MKALIATFLLVLSAGAQIEQARPVGESKPEPPTVLKVCGPKSGTPCAKPPKVVYSPDPEYTDEARKKGIEGSVVLWIVIGPDGNVKDMKVVKPLGYGLDEQAVAAVRRWRFQPATDENDKPVAVQVNVLVNFKLYDKDTSR